MALVELNVGNRLARLREAQGGCPTRSSGSSVAFVGGGPTAIYTLCALIEAATVGVAVTIYEAQLACPIFYTRRYERLLHV